MRRSPTLASIQRKERRDMNAIVDRSAELRTLYWDENGQIACGLHKPFVGSDTWRSGRWKQMNAAEIIASTANRAKYKLPPTACETCESQKRKAHPCCKA